MEERESLVCLVKVVVRLISWDSSLVREESLDLMEGVEEAISASIAVFFEEYLEDLAAGLILLVSSAASPKLAQYSALGLNL